MTGSLLTSGQSALILFGIFFGLIFLCVPVAFALALACLPILVIEPRLSAVTLICTHHHDTLGAAASIGSPCPHMPA